MYRLYGNIEDLEKTHSNSSCDYYRLTLFIKYNKSQLPVSRENGFSGYSRKEIYKILKASIISDLKKQGIQAH